MILPPNKLPPPFSRLDPTQCWQKPNGTLWLFRPAPHVIVSVTVGHLHSDSLRAFLQACAPAFESGRVWLVQDAELATGYDSQARIDTTEWLMRERHRIRGSILLTTNKLVLMGASVAGIVLSAVGVAGEITSDRKVFDRALLDAVREAR